ncbi:MAG: SDR family oxidoreductase [Comamonadaceae bacterium]|nr:MAG: SDR family oxidoreductase [Comamonadaceae bacterium]
MTERKVCIVTGSSSGIGAATARLYASRGWDVVVNFSRDAGPAEAVAAECRALGAEALVVKADVASDTDCRRLAAEVEARFGRADALVNNAGTTKFVPLKDLAGLEAEDFHRIYGVNVIGAYQMSRALAPMLQQRPGAGIVNVSSVASMMGVGSSIAYMASKGALNAMTAGLARALGPAIRVNAIAPGLVETPWLQNGLGDHYASSVVAYKARATLDAVISPEDVAETAWYLGASAAKTTGEVLLVDAGMRLTRG